MDQSQRGYQESPQTYQSLVPQTGQFSPAVEGSHSPFLTGKGSNTLQSKTFHLWILKRTLKWPNFSVQCVILLFLLLPGEADQGYSCHSAELYDSEGQRQFWPEYSSPSFTGPLPHPPAGPSNQGPQSSEQYCPRVVKRKNPHPPRPDREGQMTGMSAYPGWLSDLF